MPSAGISRLKFFKLKLPSIFGFCNLPEILILPFIIPFKFLILGGVRLNLVIL